jgi:Kef-type K+ transport system membrane component KefB
MEKEFPFLSLLLITGLAAVVPLFSRRLRRFRIPIVVGEIVAGMLVGRSGLDLIQESASLDFLSTFGFTYLMFLSGLEVDFSSITGRQRQERKGLFDNPGMMGLVVFALTLAGGFLAAQGLKRIGLVEAPLIMALILSTTSLGIVVPVLKERRLSSTRYGQALLISALVADFATLLLISVAVAAVSRGLTLDLLLVLLLLAVFAVFSQMGLRAAQFPRLRQAIDELAHATAQIKVRGAFALMVMFMVVAEGVGTEIILGAFLAGAVVSLLSDRDGSELPMKMDAIGYGFFIPIFFIMVGVRFDLAGLLASPGALVLVPVLLVLAYAIKFLAALVFRAKFSWRETLGAGALLSSRLSLIIAAAAISLELGIISNAINSAVVLVAIVTCTISPILFNRILPPQEETVRKGVILAGLGEMSALLAERLKQTGEQVTVLGADAERAEEMRRRGQGLSQILGETRHLVGRLSTCARLFTSIAAEQTSTFAHRAAAMESRPCMLKTV